MAKNLPIEEPAGIEPGEVDNRLSLVPDQFPAIAEWEDGETYDLSEVGEGVKLRQISPGEFEVLPAVGEPEAEEEEAEEPVPPAKQAMPMRGKRAVEMME